MRALILAAALSGPMLAAAADASPSADGLFFLGRWEIVSATAAPWGSASERVRDEAESKSRRKGRG